MPPGRLPCPVKSPQKFHVGAPRYPSGCWRGAGGSGHICCLLRRQSKHAFAPEESKNDKDGGGSLEANKIRRGKRRGGLEGRNAGEESGSPPPHPPSTKRNTSILEVCSWFSLGAVNQHQHPDSHINNKQMFQEHGWKCLVPGRSPGV